MEEYSLGKNYLKQNFSKFIFNVILALFLGNYQSSNEMDALIDIKTDTQRFLSTNTMYGRVLNDCVILFSKHVKYENTKVLKAPGAIDLAFIKLKPSTSCLDEVTSSITFEKIAYLELFLTQNPDVKLLAKNSNDKILLNSYKSLEHEGIFEIRETDITTTIAGKYLFSMPSAFVLALDTDTYSLTPGNSGNTIVDKFGRTIGYHRGSYFILNINLYNDLINPNLFDLKEFIKSDNLENIKASFMTNLLKSRAGKNTKYDDRLIVYIYSQIQMELSEKGKSSTYDVLLTKNFNNFANHILENGKPVNWHSELISKPDATLLDRQFQGVILQKKELLIRHANNGKIITLFAPWTKEIATQLFYQGKLEQLIDK